MIVRRIVFFIDSLHSIAAGSERQIYKLINGLVENGYEISLVLLRHTEFSRQLDDFPCSVSSLDISHVLAVSSIKKFYAFRKRLIFDEVDIVHAYFPDACIIAPMFLKSEKLQVITSRRDMGIIYHGYRQWLFRFLGARTDIVLSNSNAVADFSADQEWLSAEKGKVIYNGIEDFFRGDSPEFIDPFNANTKLKLIMVANIKPVKRILDAINAVHLIKQQGVNVQLALVGELQDACYVADIESCIQQLQLCSNIIMLGQVVEPRRLLAYADIGLLSSESEGLSNTIMEYMQAGLPSVVSKVVGNNELI